MPTAVENIPGGLRRAAVGVGGNVLGGRAGLVGGGVHARYMSLAARMNATFASNVAACDGGVLAIVACTCAVLAGTVKLRANVANRSAGGVLLVNGSALPLAAGTTAVVRANIVLAGDGGGFAVARLGPARSSTPRSRCAVSARGLGC